MIKIENLCKQFGNLEAVRNLDLHVPRGELFCFLGPNGAGKTTTIKMLTGLLKPTTGTTQIADINVQTDPVRAKRLMGYIPDMPYLYDRLTTREFYEFTGDLYGVPRDRIRRQLPIDLETFGLADHQHALVKDLSHGLRQRLIYAATFLHEPEVMFIDEPLIGLDPYTIRQIKELLVKKTRDGMTIFLTTHILALAQEIADRIGIILSGRLVALGTLDELRATSGIDGTLEDIFLGLTNDMNGPGNV
jgi:ABC-2 type transport system ATP-binding protein